MTWVAFDRTSACVGFVSFGFHWKDLTASDDHPIVVTCSTFGTVARSPNHTSRSVWAPTSALLPINACAVKAGAFQWELDPPGNWFVPPGNNRSGGGGNKAVGAFDVEGRLSGSVSM